MKTAASSAIGDGMIRYPVLYGSMLTMVSRNIMAKNAAARFSSFILILRD